MREFEPPILNTNLVCITSSEVDLELLSTVCCYINDSNSYFPIFKMPEIKSPFIETEDISDDDYFTSVVIKKAFIQMMNAIARIRCRNILLVGLSDLQKKYLKIERYWKVTFIEINCMPDIIENLKFLNRQFEGVLHCLKNEISRGLQYAKYENKLLIVDDNASSINNYIKDKGEGLIVIESSNDISDVIIVNFAFSVNADVLFINKLEASEVKNL